MENALIVGRDVWLEQEDLNHGACSLSEMKSCLYNFRIVEYHQRTARDVLREIIEHILPYRSLVVDKQFAVISFGQRELCDAIVGQIVIVILYSDILCIHYLSFNQTKMAHIETTTIVYIMMLKTRWMSL